jgi:hypothetical protein
MVVGIVATLDYCRYRGNSPHGTWDCDTGPQIENAELEAKE